jgi:hypothetical protein
MQAMGKLASFFYSIGPSRQCATVSACAKASALQASHFSHMRKVWTWCWTLRLGEPFPSSKGLFHRVHPYSATFFSETLCGRVCCGYRPIHTPHDRSQREFIERFQTGGAFPMLASACPGATDKCSLTTGFLFAATVDCPLQKRRHSEASAHTRA